MDERPFGWEDYVRLTRLVALAPDPGDARRLGSALAARGLRAEAFAVAEPPVSPEPLGPPGPSAAGFRGVGELVRVPRVRVRRPPAG